MKPVDTAWSTYCFVAASKLSVGLAFNKTVEPNSAAPSTYIEPSTCNSSPVSAVVPINVLPVSPLIVILVFAVNVPPVNIIKSLNALLVPNSNADACPPDPPPV